MGKIKKRLWYVLKQAVLGFVVLGPLILLWYMVAILFYWWVIILGIFNILPSELITVTMQINFQAYTFLIAINAIIMFKFSQFWPNIILDDFWPTVKLDDGKD